MPKNAKNAKKKQMKAGKAKNATNAKSVKIAEIVKMAEIAEVAEIAEIANIVETEALRFLAMFKKLGLFWKNRWNFRKKDGVLFNISKIGKFAVDCVSNVFLRQKCLPP